PMGTVVVHLQLDQESDEAIKLYDIADPGDADSQFIDDPSVYTITFDSSNWYIPVRVGVHANNDARREDPQTAVIKFELQSTTNPDFQFPNLRSGPGLLDVEVIDDDTAGAVVLESAGDTLMIVDDLSTAADETQVDNYKLRLTKQPEIPGDSPTDSPIVKVAVLTDGLADVTLIDGVAPTIEEIGGLRPAQKFHGSIIFEVDGTRGKLTYGTGDDLRSFLEDGFEEGEQIRIGGAGAPYDGDYFVDEVTPEAVWITVGFFGVSDGDAPVEVQDDVVLSDLTREGVYDGQIEFEIGTDSDGNDYRRIVRTDASSWLADGFLEGQMVRVTNLDNPTQTVDYKIAIIRGDNATFDDKLEFVISDDPLTGANEDPDPAWWTDGNTVNVSVTRLAAVVTFTDTDWYVERDIQLTPDRFYEVPITREGVKIFPVQTHLLSKLRGPLAVEGGTTGADRSLKNGLKLPGEKDAFLIAIGEQPPESQQIDVLNIFNDSSQQDWDGVMTETTLTGFGMAKELDFGPIADGSFGEPPIFPGGISFGKINFGPGGFATNQGQSTIEVVNVMLGQGNDVLDITGTLDPAPAVSALQEFTFIDGYDGNGNPLAFTGGTITKEGFDWKAEGFLVGQTVTIDGVGGWTVEAIDDVITIEGQDPNDNSLLVLSGPSLAAYDADPSPTNNGTAIVEVIATDAPVIVELVVDFEPADPVVKTTEFQFTETEEGAEIIGTTPFDWREAGFQTGQVVEIASMPGKQWEVAAIRDQVFADDDNFILFLSGGDAISTAVATTTITGLLAGGTVTRSDGKTWEEDGFIVGHLVSIQNDLLQGNWRLREIIDPVDPMDPHSGGYTMVLEGEQLPAFAADTLPTVFSVQGRHGGLTTVHGGGNLPLEIEYRMFVDSTPSFDDLPEGTDIALTRDDGLDWQDDRYQVGQRIQLAGESGTRELLGFANADDDLENSLEPAEAFNSWGNGSVMFLGEIQHETVVALPDGYTPGEITVHVAEPLKESFTGTVDIATSSLTRADGMDWADDGFEVGQHVFISGLAGPFTISGLAGDVMELNEVALTPRDGVENVTVFGYDIELDGGVRMGGDHITVTGGAGPDSPLVVYGDTSQDGVWYSGHPNDILGYEFGEKPFDPFPELSDGENEDDEWVFPLANPYKYAGNDVIDASQLFADLDAADLPTVGFVAYGGEGNDTIYGSQAGDHLAGGSGDDLIYGNRGVDHIYGDSGVNVNILTRALTIATVDHSPEPTIDNSLQTNGTTIDPYPSPVLDEMEAGRDVIYGDGPMAVLGGPESAYDDVIFGDHGEVVQYVFDPNLPDPLFAPGALQKIQTTELNTILAINSLELQNGDDDVIFGNEGRDIIIAGAGHDMADGDQADDLIFGDSVYLARRDLDHVNPTDGEIADGNLYDDITNPRFQALLGTLLYSRSDQELLIGPDGAGVAAPNADNSGELLNDDIARDYRDPDGAPWWAEYSIDYSTLHTFEFDEGGAGVGSFGNDYIAGGAHHDQIFGQLGDDVIQGDGGIEAAFTLEALTGE
ncbi:MAG: hypothetical protein PVJ49_18535, partial [Acidobacteriota bacterium]